MTRAGARERADELDQLAGLAYRRGELVEAAGWISAAAKADPGRGDHWAERTRALSAAAERKGWPLATQCAFRLALAGISPDDEGLAQIRAWNRSHRVAPS